MPTTLQFRRYGTAATASVTGANAELTVDTDKKTVVVHDGSTAGGFPLVRANGDTMTGQLNISSGGLLVTGNVNLDSGTLFVNSISNRVGIGTTTPNANLSILGSGGFDGNVFIGDSYGSTISGTDGRLTIVTSDGDYKQLKLVTWSSEFSLRSYSDDRSAYLNYYGYAPTEGVQIYSTDIVSGGESGDNGSIIRLLTVADSSNSAVERVRVTNTGNVGIGTTTPSATLDVAGPVFDQFGNLRKIPQSGTEKSTSYTLAANDVGRLISITTSGSVVVPNGVFSSGDVISVYNNTAANITMTLNPANSYISGNNTNRNNAVLNVSTRGVATILYLGSNNCVVTGSVSV